MSLTGNVTEKLGKIIPKNWA